MGLKSAVMVVGGSKMEGGEERAVCDGDDDDDGSVEDSDECGRGPGWNDGVAASGRVVNRMPVETTETYVRSAFSVFSCGTAREGGTTSSALLLRTKVDLGSDRDPTLEAAFHRVLLVYPLLHIRRPATSANARRREALLLLLFGLVRDASSRRCKLAKVVE